MSKVLADYLKKIRESRNLSLREVERITGINHGYLSQVESNQRQIPRFNVLDKLAKAYGITISEIMEINEAQLKKEGIENERLAFHAPDVKFIVRCYLQLNEEGKKLASNYLGFLYTLYKRQGSKKKGDEK